MAQVLLIIVLTPFHVPERVGKGVGTDARVATNHYSPSTDMTFSNVSEDVKFQVV